LSLNRFANRDGARILGAVHPDHQRRGIGRALLTAAESATDRPQLRAPVWVGTAGEHAVPAMGYERSHSHQVRRLDLHDQQPPDLVAVGEVGLSGEVRRVGGVGRRLAEAARLGFTAAVVPPDPGRLPPGMRVLEAPDLRTALAALRDPDAFALRPEAEVSHPAGPGRRLVSVPAAGRPGPPPPP